VATSGNCVYHYTGQIEHLINILSDGFKISYCKETIITDDHSRTFAIPILSFCDIPLSQVKDHMTKYGEYAIGLTMEWAVNYGLNPVIYLEQKSILNRSLDQVLGFMHEDWHEIMEEDDFDHWYETTYKSTIGIIKSMKNFEGPLTRNGNTVNYKFYDEREWRYIPTIAEKHNSKYPDIFWEDEFEDLKDRFPAKPHFSDYVIGLEGRFIKHLIVSSEEEVSFLIEKLATMKHLHHNEKEFNLLLTRIKTAKQIKEDF
jgi:hypothetical protein